VLQNSGLGNLINPLTSLIMTDDQTLATALRHLLRYGLIVINADGASTDTSQLCERLAGFVDKSYFGEFFDLEVKPDDQTDSGRSAPANSRCTRTFPTTPHLRTTSSCTA
jgi:hypothetical protein